MILSADWYYMIAEKAADMILGNQPLEAQIIADGVNPAPGSRRLSA